MTIYRLYTENGNRAGFWVQHRAWSNLCAHVLSINGCESGKLPGDTPLHDHAKITLQCFDVRSGRPAESPVVEENPADRNFVTIAVPSWY